MNTNVDKELNELISELKLYKKMYDIVRIVDPIKKNIYYIQKAEVMEHVDKCFWFWEKGEICTNCISIRSYNENKSYVKIEYTNHLIFMITSIPVIINEKKLIIEMMKDATDSMLITNENDNEAIHIKHMIDQLTNNAVKDPLTETYNRRFLNERLPVDIMHATLNKIPLSIILADIDHFKHINDTYGHLAGDYILKEFTKIIDDIIGENNWLARYGGEEFLICLPDTNRDRAVKVAENIRNSLATKTFNYNDTSINITSSFGVASTESIKNYAMENLLSTVDNNLYVAKNTGRNKVC